MSPKTVTQKSAKSATVTGKGVKGFTDEERTAMKERVRELKAEARRGPRAKNADRESEVLAKIAEICFFQSAHKFKARYATFGFSDKANLDEGTLWPVAFALKELTAADEAKIGALV